MPCRFALAWPSTDGACHWIASGLIGGRGRKGRTPPQAGRAHIPYTPSLIAAQNPAPPLASPKYSPAKNIRLFSVGFRWHFCTRPRAAIYPLRIRCAAL